MDDAERLVEVETRIAFQERSIAKLQEAVLEQQRQIDRLTRLCESLKRQLSGPGVALDPRDEPPPPHYQGGEVRRE
jgi:SlyX protein